MRVVRHPLPGRSPVAIAIGSFDGVHRGHAALFARVNECARSRGLESAALTFEPQPRELFAPANAPARLTTLAEKLTAFAGLGIGTTFVQRFDRAFAALDAATFARWLHENLAARHVFVGEDFRFGAQRASDCAGLSELGRALGFEVEVMPAVVECGERISSTSVRDALARGDLATAARLLGRAYCMSGRVMHGAMRGRTLGFPTANVRLGRLKPALSGIFAVKCFGAATRGLEGVASLGTNPAVQRNGPATLEAFLFDFQGDLYGRRLSIEFVKKLRDEADFASLDALAAQIKRDCDAAREYFRTTKP
jgi:riboflavin kinase / FMN adenylyltransferase